MLNTNIKLKGFSNFKTVENTYFCPIRSALISLLLKSSTESFCNLIDFGSNDFRTFFRCKLEACLCSSPLEAFLLTPLSKC